MSNLIWGFCIVTLIFSCKKEGFYTTEQPKIIIPTSNTPVIQGVFIPTAGIVVSGKVDIFLKENKYFLRLIDFSVSSGPDLKVYLSMGDTPFNFVNLGALQNNAVYEIPSTVIPSAYSHVLIHCQQYNHLFAVAKIN